MEAIIREIRRLTALTRLDSPANIVSTIKQLIVQLDPEKFIIENEITHVSFISKETGFAVEVLQNNSFMVKMICGCRYLEIYNSVRDSHRISYLGFYISKKISFDEINHCMYTRCFDNLTKENRPSIDWLLANSRIC